MQHPEIWNRLRVPLNWQKLPKVVLQSCITDVLEARDNLEVQLMIDFDDEIWWRRDINEYSELGL